MSWRRCFVVGGVDLRENKISEWDSRIFFSVSLVLQWDLAGTSYLRGEGGAGIPDGLSPGSSSQPLSKDLSPSCSFSEHLRQSVPRACRRPADSLSVPHPPAFF